MIVVRLVILVMGFSPFLLSVFKKAGINYDCTCHDTIINDTNLTGKIKLKGG